MILIKFLGNTKKSLDPSDDDHDHDDNDNDDNDKLLLYF